LWFQVSDTVFFSRRIRHEPTDLDDACEYLVSFWPYAVRGTPKC